MARITALQPSRSRSLDPGKVGRNLAKHAVLILGATAAAFPFYWMITTSFKELGEAAKSPPLLWPTS